MESMNSHAINLQGTSPELLGYAGNTRSTQCQQVSNLADGTAVLDRCNHQEHTAQEYFSTYISSSQAAAIIPFQCKTMFKNKAEKIDSLNALCKHQHQQVVVIVFNRMWFDCLHWERSCSGASS
jgi:hypothetical protein